MNQHFETSDSFSLLSTFFFCLTAVKSDVKAATTTATTATTKAITAPVTTVAAAAATVRAEGKKNLNSYIYHYR